MSYRKITVDGVDYKYTVGQSHVKVQGLGVWPKDEIGELIDDMNWGDTYTVQVKPVHVAAKIRDIVRFKK